MESSHMIFFRVYDDGVAFKYFVPNQASISNYNIIDEYTEFNLNSDDTAGGFQVSLTEGMNFFMQNLKLIKFQKIFF